MAARTPRRSFATPFVITLVAAPACYVQSTPPPQGPPPQEPSSSGVVANPPPPTTQQPQQPSQPPPVVIANPPPPTTQGPPPPGTKPTQPKPPPTTTPTQSQEQKWTVYKTKDGCMAAIKVECMPKATCNPPPPFKYACPDNVSLEKPITIATYDGTSCFVEFEAPKCPPNTVCNPPRPRAVACPKR